MGDIYIAAHLRRCLRHSVFGHVLQYTPSTSVLDALHLHHAIKSPPLRYPSPLHIAFIEVKNELVKMKNVFPMKVITYTITHTANFAGGRSRLDLLLPSFLPSREEKKIQDQKNRPLGSRCVLHTPHMDRVRTETKKQDRIFCPLRGHSVGRMRYAPTSCRQETLFPINSRKERIETKIQEQKNRPLGSRGVLHIPHGGRVREETKMQERRKQSIDSGAEWHTPFMRQGKRDEVWRDTFLEQRARVAVWRDTRLEERSSHARLQMRISGENSNPYKSSLVALSEQLRDIFSA